MMRIDKTSLWLPFCSGILLSLTLPTSGLWPLVWVALVPFFVFAAQKELSHKRLCLGALLFGIPYATALTYPMMRVTGWWWVEGMESFGSKVLELQFAFTMFAIGVWGALFFILVAYVVRRFGLTAYGAVFIASAFVAIEWVRSVFALFGFGLGVLGYSLIDTQYLKHGAALLGVYVLTFLIVSVNISLIALWSVVSHTEGRWWKRFSPLIDVPQKHTGIWCTVVVFAALFSFGVFREAHMVGADPMCESPLRVAVIGSQMTTTESVGGEAYQYYRTNIEKAIGESATLILLPENAFPFFEINEVDSTLNKQNLTPLPDQAVLYADFLALSALHPDVVIALGMHSSRGEAYYNSLVLFEGGVPTTYYHKRKLVPFAEYEPLGRALSVMVPLTAGEAKPVFMVHGILATALICSEVADTTIPLRGARIILSPSNDSVFYSSAIGVVHHNASRMRALESGAFLLRATKGGISSIIDPHGNVIAANKGEGVVVADICTPAENY